METKAPKKESKKKASPIVEQVGVEIKKRPASKKRAEQPIENKAVAPKKRAPNPEKHTAVLDSVIMDKLRAIISNYTQYPERLADIEEKSDVNFVEELNIDSVDVVEIVVDVEQEFKISIADDEIKKFKSFGDIYNLIIAKLKETTAAA